MNSVGDDGTTLLTFAVVQRVPLCTLRQLLELPCLDLAVRDAKFHLSPIQLAHHLRRQDVLNFFMTLVVF